MGAQIIGTIKGQEAGMPTAELCRKQGLSQGTFYTFKSMQDNLRKERVFIEKQWALRAKQIGLVIASTVGMHGDLQGIAGRSMPDIESVEALLIGKDD